MRLKPEDGLAIVTGAGSGLGRAMAIKLSGLGFAVAVIGRNSEALKDTVAQCRLNATPVTLDVADTKAVEDAFGKLIAQHGAICLLVNNAAVYPQRDFLQESSENFMATCAVNLGGVVACSHAALQDMAPRGRGRILNVATFADLNPLPGAAAYSVSKGAARIFSRALIADLQDRFPDIIINDWMPGMLNTKMGIPDGLSPKTAADWGVELALQMDRDLTGTTFEMGTEVLPPRGLKGRLKDMILFRTPKPRVLKPS